MTRQVAPAGKKPASKGKDKKLQRKAELEKLKQKLTLINAASQVSDLLEPFAAFKAYNRRGVEASISCSRAAELPAGVADWAFRLCKANMQEFYENARDMGWSDSKKRAQLTAPEARLLVVTGKVDGREEQLLAYSHFRFEMEGECAVLYCWELQVEAAAKRKGLGRFLMQLLELLARRAGMEWVMLTVMTANADAFGLYSSLGYTMDDTSPSACDAADDAGYEILSKQLSAALKAEVAAAAGGSAAAAAAAVQLVATQPAAKKPATKQPAAGVAASAGAVGGGSLRAPMAALAVN